MAAVTQVRILVPAYLFILFISLLCQGVKKIDNLQIFSSYNLDISETSPRDIILIRILRGIYSSNYKILVVPIKVGTKFSVCNQPSMEW